MLLFRSSLNSKPWEVLRIPIEAATKNQEFDFVIERVQGRLSSWEVLSWGCMLSRLMSCKESCYLEKPLKPLIKPVEILFGDLLWKK